MDRHSQRVPRWALSPNPGRGSQRPNGLAEALPEHSAHQHPNGLRIPPPPSPVLSRIASLFHVHDPMYHRPTHHRRLTESPEQAEEGLQPNEALLGRRREQARTREEERLRTRINRLRSHTPLDRPASPRGGEQPSDRQPQSHMHRAAVLQSLPVFPHGLPIPYNPWGRDAPRSSLHRGLPPHGQRRQARTTNPIHEYLTNELMRNYNGEGIGSEPMYHGEPPHLDLDHSPVAPLVGPEGQRQPAPAQNVPSYWGPPSRNQAPQTPNDATPDTSDRGYTPSSPHDDSTTRASMVNNVDSNVSRSARDHREAGGFGAQRPDQLDADVNQSHRRPRRRPLPSLSLLNSAVTGQRERTQQPETHNAASERPAENPQRPTITVDGDCYVCLDSPDELIGEGHWALRVMPFVRVRGDLYIRTPAPRQQKRKRDESSNGDDEMDSNIGSEADAEDTDDRPAKRR
ncbi:hypothetical protein F5Y13DRAFT_203248 [Hypoxylon sp. FL1857]|nr:hypothetical protein F5Y13DRAFT_203248 [Hypoxylon sp. FL1857]